MTTDRQALLNNILENPNDDMARMVFADFLEEHGEANRGELIRVQIELAEIGPEPECTDFREFSDPEGFMCCDPDCPYTRMVDLQNREQKLLDANPNGMRNANWWALDLADIASAEWEWHRGFVESLACSSTDWFAHHEAIRASHPVREVRLTDRGIFAHARYNALTRQFIFEAGRRKRAVSGRYEDAFRPDHDSNIMYVLGGLWPRIDFHLPGPEFDDFVPVHGNFHRTGDRP